MKVRYLISVILCVGMLFMTGCGKKKSSTPPPPPVETQPTSTTAIAGLAMKGPIIGATVSVFAVRSNVTDTVPLGQGTTDLEGKYAVQTFGYRGPVVVQITGGSYKDEISHDTVAVKVPLRAMFSSAATGTTTIMVTPLTELAVDKALGSGALSNTVIDSSNTFVAGYFGISDIVNLQPSNEPTATASQKQYVKALGSISQLVTNSLQPDGFAPGQSRDDAFAAVMGRLGGELQHDSVFSSATISALDRAIGLFSDGVGTTTPPSIIPPPPPPAGGVLKLATSGPAGSVIDTIIVTVNLPDGVTVDFDPVTGFAAPGSVTVSGTTVGATLGANVFPASGATPGKVVMDFNNNRGFGLGEFVTINFKFTKGPQGTFASPAGPAAFTLTGTSFTRHLNAVAGITAAPLSLSAI